MAKGGYVYIMTNLHHTVLYVGVTSDQLKRVYQHKNKKISGFAQKYNCTKLIYWEEGADIASCIAREKQIKAGSRKKKEMLINALNPSWADMSDGWY